MQALVHIVIVNCQNFADRMNCKNFYANYFNVKISWPTLFSAKVDGILTWCSSILVKSSLNGSNIGQHVILLWCACGLVSEFLQILIYEGEQKECITLRDVSICIFLLRVMVSKLFTWRSSSLVKSSLNSIHLSFCKEAKRAPFYNV